MGNFSQVKSHFFSAKMQCKCIVPETFSQFFRPPEWGQIEGVIHTGSNYANFVWLMKFTVCLFVSFPLQVWLLHLPFISPVFWDLYTYKVLYSQFLTQALLDFITEILYQTKEDCVYHCWRHMTHPSSTLCNYFLFQLQSFFRAFKWIIFGLPVRVRPCTRLSMISVGSINLSSNFESLCALIKLSLEGNSWAILSWEIIRCLQQLVPGITEACYPCM